MSVMQVLRATLERTLNFALANDIGAEKRLAAVAGKTFRLRVGGLPEPITLLFHGHGVSVMGPAYEVVDCEVITSLSDLTELQDASKITQLIHSGRVQVIGDPVLAQQAAVVFKQLDIDWESLLSDYLGDVPGYWLSQFMAKAGALKPQPGALESRASEMLTEELRVAASPLAFALLVDDSKALAQRLQALEQRWQAIQTNTEEQGE